MYDSAFARLAMSKFRSRFHLSEADVKYIADKGMDTIRRHAEDFVRAKLAPAHPLNDGRQTPMRGHPVFKAQHACACCCRGCMAKWWKVPEWTEIPPERQTRIVDFLMEWIARETARVARRDLRHSTCDLPRDGEGACIRRSDNGTIYEQGVAE